MLSMKDIGKRVYNLDNSREKRRYYVFLLRSLMHRGELRQLMEFFGETPARQRLIEINPYPIEQVTRAFFYNKSTFADRMQVVRGHYELLEGLLQEKYFLQISGAKWNPFTVWEGTYEEKPWQAQMVFETGQRKEGLLSLELNVDGTHIYQVMFWAGLNKNGEPAIWIGALQGPNMENARDVVKKMTKACHGYRTKNLILYMLQVVARTLGIKRLYAVSNYGYYANNHVRANRKLKTNFGDFWLEAGGKETEDSRFYELPLVEHRKTMEEVPTRKRAVYRRRFEFLDAVDAEIEETVKKIMK